MNVNELNAKLIEKGEKISKATKIRSLIQKQKGFLKKKQSLTDFNEPVLFLIRRSGIMDMYEKATAGKFTFEHTNGKTRFIELRPTDQVTFPYGDKRIRAYVGHEDRPYTGWDNPIIDSETVTLGLEKVKATDLKYQERIEALKNKGKLTWVYIIIGLAIAIAIGGFAYMTWIQPALERRAEAAARLAQQAPPVAGAIWFILKKKWKESSNKYKQEKVLK